MPTLPVSDILRLVQFETDVGILVTVIRVRLKESSAFRVWQSANPAPTDTPLLISGQTVPTILM